MVQSTNSDHAFRSQELYGTGIEPTFAGALSAFRRRYTRDLTQVDFAITGIPFDTAVTNRPGSRFGPRGVRAASAHMTWGSVWPWAFDPFTRLAAVDYGDCLFDFGHPESAPPAIEAHASEIINAGSEVISIGGDHFVSLPLLRAHAKKYGKLSLVHFDAHSDTWETDDGRVDHGTMFRHAVMEGIIDPETSVQIGIRTHNSDPMGFTWLDAQWVHDNGTDAAIKEAKRIVADNKAYLTFDIDCLDPAFAPGTGTPVSGGLSTAQAQSIIRGLGDINFVGMDLVEVAPDYDHAEITALAAASIILDYLCMRAQHLPDQIDPVSGV